MNNEATIKFLDKESHSFSNVGETMQQLGMNKFPYATKLSFVPLINYWKERLESPHIDEKIIAQEVVSRLKNLSKFEKTIEDISLVKENNNFVELLLSSFFSSVQRERNLGGAHQPFVMTPFYKTPAMWNLLKSGKLNICFDVEKKIAKTLGIISACSFILNRHYGQNIDVDVSFIYSIEIKGSAQVRYYRVDEINDFVEVVPLKPLRKISQNQINQMLSNIYNEKLWLELLPPDHFEFQGLVMNQLFDVTEKEILSRIKYKLLQKDAIIKPQNILALEKDLKTYFNIPKLKMGITAIDYPAGFTVAHKYKIRHDFLAKKHDSLINEKNKGSIYEKVCKWNEILIIEDLTKYEDHTSLPKDLLQEGFKSIIISPLVNEDNHVIGLLEIGAPNPFQLTSFEEIKLKAVIPLFCMSLLRSREEVDNKIEAILREEYTAMHPSVEWKFVEGAFKIMEQREIDPDYSEVDDISFKEVYPLYGQADIVGSSNQRNQSIQTDLLINLDYVKVLLKNVQKNIQFPLLDYKLLQIEKNIKSIQTGISSDDESRMIEFLEKEIHPVLKSAKNRHPDVRTRINSYFNKLDPTLGFVYQDRKLYENSVAKINETISLCLQESEKRAQKMIPHYFSEYKTDGVEYDIYVGQSLLEKGKFNTLHLQNLRLWQLITMIEITRKVEALKSELAVPLSTAQLIFVYGNALTIRFRMDEKRFDVDGAYNVRYEIIKKRIDKAIIENTGERLTVKGKIAIVYTSEKDKIEYLEYLNYLKEKKYITDDIEDLALAKMQGVEGLKALRVTVVVDF